MSGDERLIALQKKVEDAAERVRLSEETVSTARKVVGQLKVENTDLSKKLNIAMEAWSNGERILSGRKRTLRDRGEYLKKGYGC